jgi:hypothetical protein
MHEGLLPLTDDGRIPAEDVDRLVAERKRRQEALGEIADLLGDAYE